MMELSEIVRRLEGQVAALEARVQQLETALSDVLVRDESSPHHTLRCKRLVIEGSNRKTRAEISSTPEGAQILLFDASHPDPMLSVRSSRDNSSLILHNTGGEAIGALWTTDEGAALDLKTHDGGLRARLLAHESGGGLSLLGETGGARVTAGVAGDHGQLALSLSGGDTGVALGTTDDGGHIIICDDEGQAKISLP